MRIALNLKNLPAEVIFVDLDADAHRAQDYRSVNPQMALPSLVLDDGTVLFSRSRSSNISRRRIPLRRCCRPIRAAAPGCARWR